MRQNDFLRRSKCLIHSQEKMRPEPSGKTLPRQLQQILHPRDAELREQVERLRGQSERRYVTACACQSPSSTNRVRNGDAGFISLPRQVSAYFCDELFFSAEQPADAGDVQKKMAGAWVAPTRGDSSVAAISCFRGIHSLPANQGTEPLALLGQ